MVPDCTEHCYCYEKDFTYNGASKANDLVTFSKMSFTAGADTSHVQATNR